MPYPEGKYITDNQIGEIQYWAMLHNGEKAGLEGIYKMFSQELFRYGMAIKPNRSFIKDCVQELFMDLWKYRNTLKQTDQIKLYLFKSLSNRIHREVTKDKKIYHQEDICNYEYLFLQESHEQALILQQGDDKVQSKLRRAMDNLPSRQKEVIQLLFFKNLSYEDISKIMGITIQSVYTLAWKALANLKKTIIVIILSFFI